MWPSKPHHEYHAVPSTEDEAFEKRETGPSRVPNMYGSRSWTLLLGYSLAASATVLALVLVLVIAIFWTLALRGPCANVDAENDATRCPIRKEWRTLSSIEQQNYISAVQCLRTLNSTISSDPAMSAYDDFPWIHSHIGYSTHNSALFLPWHRYFLHVYETTLREGCGYDGSLAYWDWTLDYQALEKSPVFDARTGFGGDGDLGGEMTVGRTGRCLVDGPFAGVEVKYYDVKHVPHCLSRGFRDLAGDLGHIDGTDVSPDSIEEVVRSDSYENFLALMESRVHDAIPLGIAGDFETITASYDPLFFLHHTQLDRLWWLWQQQQPAAGVESYGGRKAQHSMDMSTLDDLLEYRPLAPNVKVAEVMNVENGMLCYAYSLR